MAQPVWHLLSPFLQKAGLIQAADGKGSEPGGPEAEAAHGNSPARSKARGGVSGYVQRRTEPGRPRGQVAGGKHAHSAASTPYNLPTPGLQPASSIALWS